MGRKWWWRQRWKWRRKAKGRDAGEEETDAGEAIPTVWQRKQKKKRGSQAVENEFPSDNSKKGRRGWDDENWVREWERTRGKTSFDSFHSVSKCHTFVPITFPVATVSSPSLICSFSFFLSPGEALPSSPTSSPLTQCACLCKWGN